PCISSVTYSSFHLLSPFVFTATSTYYSYTLSLHDALPISVVYDAAGQFDVMTILRQSLFFSFYFLLLAVHVYLLCALLNSFLKKDRKSTRLNSSHVSISYPVFCLKINNHISVFDILLLSLL